MTADEWAEQNKPTFSPEVAAQLKAMWEAPLPPAPASEEGAQP